MPSGREGINTLLYYCITSSLPPRLFGLQPQQGLPRRGGEPPAFSMESYKRSADDAGFDHDTSSRSKAACLEGELSTPCRGSPRRGRPPCHHACMLTRCSCSSADKLEELDLAVRIKLRSMFDEGLVSGPLHPARMHASGLDAVPPPCACKCQDPATFWPIQQPHLHRSQPCDAPPNSRTPQRRQPRSQRLVPRARTNAAAQNTAPTARRLSALPCAPCLPLLPLLQLLPVPVPLLHLTSPLPPAAPHRRPSLAPAPHPHSPPPLPGDARRPRRTQHRLPQAV